MRDSKVYRHKSQRIKEQIAVIQSGDCMPSFRVGFYDLPLPEELHRLFINSVVQFLQGEVKAIEEKLDTYDEVEHFIPGMKITEPDLASAKPPIGVMPRNIYEDRRIIDITRAINDRLHSGLTIPDAWPDELSDLLWRRTEGANLG